jgi:hypothetical protein
MMMRIVLIGLGAGAAAALLFASVASGAVLSILLFYLAPLPIMIAALGWSHWAGLIAAVAASAALALAFGNYFFLAFLIVIGLPAWWLGYLALLGREVTGADGGVEWYPPGRLVLWAAVIGTLIVVAAIPHFGLNQDSFQSALKQAFESVLQVQPDATVTQDLAGATDPARIIDFLVVAGPPAAAVVSTITLTLNLWLAGLIVKISGRLKRPWPTIPAMTFPTLAPALIAAAVACSFLPDLPGLVSRIFTASLLMAYALLGFAVLHAITRDLSSRGFVLAGAYAATFVFGWPVLIMTLLGLADTAFSLRTRFGQKRGPPAPRI